MDLAFLKQRYDYELERRDKLTSAVSQPVGFLTGLGSLLVVMARDFSYEERWLAVLFITLLGVAVSALAVGMWNLATAYSLQRYKQLAHLGELSGIEERVRSTYLSSGKTDAEATEEFAAVLRAQIVEVGDYNAAYNNRRTTSLGRANSALLFVLAFTCSAGLSYLADHATRYMMSKKPVVKKTDVTDEWLKSEAKRLFPPSRELHGLKFESRMPPGFDFPPLPWWIRIFVRVPKSTWWEPPPRADEKPEPDREG